jgi:hypothetical protein
MTTHGVLKYADGAGYAAQIPQLIESARELLMSVIPIREDADSEARKDPGASLPGKG